jgi:hypothetical protein
MVFESLMPQQRVSTACGSGRVGVSLDPPATAGGTDPLAQHSLHLTLWLWLSAFHACEVVCDVEGQLAFCNLGAHVFDLSLERAVG